MALINPYFSCKFNQKINILLLKRNIGSSPVIAKFDMDVLICYKASVETTIP